MRKIFLFSFLILFLTFSVSGCNYTQENYGDVVHTVFYENGTRLDYPLIEIVNFKQGYNSEYWGHLDIDAEFTVKNNHPFRIISLNVSFIKNGINDLESLVIDPLGYKVVKRTESDQIDINTVSLSFLDDDLSYNSETVREVVNISCKMCGEQLCLEDGQTCTSDKECGSNVCSGMRICVKDKNLRADCSENLSFCSVSKTCVQREVKSFGEFASCEWECKSGFLENGKCKTCENSECLKEGQYCERDSQCGNQICNQNNQCGPIGSTCEGVKQFCEVTSKCMVPSIKKKGEGYSCDFECATQRGDGKVCIDSLEEYQRKKKIEKIFFILFGVISFLLILYFIILKKIIPSIKEKQRLEKEIKNLETRFEDLTSKVSLLEKEIESSEKKIRELKEKLKNAGKAVKEEIERKIAQEEERQKVKIENLKKAEEDLKRYGTILSKRDYIAKKIKENTEKEIEAALKRYGRNYGLSRIFYDPESGYIKFNDGKKEPIHRYIYRSKFGIGNNYEVHHIDKDKLNNEIYNLIAIKEEKHSNLNHGKIDSQSWKSGILELKNQLDMRESDFPEHIIREAKKRKIKL